MNVEIFDERRCELGEGPISFGLQNESLAWVDITGQRVYFRDLKSGEINEWNVGEDIGFIIPRSDGGFILGNRTGPIAIEPSAEFPKRPIDDLEPTRLNDAKVSPTGDLWFGSMSYAETEGAGSLYRVSQNKKLKKILSHVSVSNGIMWSLDGELMYYIDSPTRSVQIFDYDGRDISNRRVGIVFPEGYGFPDGMTIDAEGNLWIAFWMGSSVRAFDPSQGFAEIAKIETPAKRTTSCVFAGENLDLLIITSAHKNDSSEPQQAGMTYIVRPGVSGVATKAFQEVSKRN
jgi:sugar lactone lactonase YvrE